MVEYPVLEAGVLRVRIPFPVLNKKPLYIEGFSVLLF